MTESFQFQTEQFAWTEVDLKGEKKHYVEGFISTSDKDDANEVITEAAQDKILAEVKGKVITMDIDHEEWYGPDGAILNKPKNEKIPVAKIVEASRKANGVWVKAEINSNSDRFDNVWGSIKSKFLHSFSIAFYPVKAVTKSINGVVHRFVEDLKLINVTLTGSPVNTSATFVPVMKAALKSIEETNMTENEVKQEAAPEAVKEEVVQEKAPETAPEAVENKNINKPEKDIIDNDGENINVLNNSVADLTSQIEQQKAQIVELSEQISAQNTQANEAAVEEAVAAPLAQIKALNAELAKLKAELKAPVIKATQTTIPTENPEMAPTSPLENIR